MTLVNSDRFLFTQAATHQRGIPLLQVTNISNSIGQATAEGIGAVSEEGCSQGMRKVPPFQHDGSSPGCSWSKFLNEAMMQAVRQFTRAARVIRLTEYAVRRQNRQG